MSNREWERREPIRRNVVVESLFCPTCDTELDATSCFNDGDQCKCGTWTYVMRMRDEGESGYRFKRNMNEEEIREDLRRKKIELERQLLAVKEELGE